VDCFLHVIYTVRIILGNGATCDTFLNSARDAERFATNINAVGQTVPEKSKKMSVICAYSVYISILSERMPYPNLAQAQPIVTCSSSLKPALAVLSSGVYVTKLAHMVQTQCTENY